MRSLSGATVKIANISGTALSGRITLSTRDDQSTVPAQPLSVKSRDMPASLGRGPLLRNTAFSLTHQTVSMALAILLIPYMLWMLGPERYGLWLILQLFNIVGLAHLAELGFQGAIVRYLARFFIEGDKTAFRGLLSSGFFLFVGIGLLIGGAVILFAQTAFTVIFPVRAEYLHEMRLALTIIGGGLIFGFPGLVIKAYFAGRQDLAFTKVWELIDRIVFAVGTLVLLQSTTSLVALVLFEQVLGLILTTVFTVLAWRRSTGWFTLRLGLPTQGHLSGVVRMSGSVFGTQLVAQGFNRGPELFVGAFLGPVTLTAYQLCTRIPRAIKTLQGSLNGAVLPHLAGLDAFDGGQNGTSRTNFAVKGLRANYIVAIPLLVATAVFAPIILELWVGPEYRNLGGFMAVFAGFQGLFLASNFCNATLVQQEHFRVFVRVNLAILVTFFAALSLYIESQGLGFLFGGLLAAGIAMLAGVIVVFWQAHGVPFARFAREVLIGPVIISGLAGALLFSLPAALIGSGNSFAGIGALLVTGVTYLFVLALFVLTSEERQRIFTFTTRTWRK